jgi:N-acetylglutamate synthase/N-acetylornithine aminotransferase
MAIGGMTATDRFQQGANSGRIVAASNMATLAVTAALSQQLEAIPEQLQEISETLEGTVKDKDRERLSEALAANEILFEIAETSAGAESPRRTTCNLRASSTE